MPIVVLTKGKQGKVMNTAEKIKSECGGNVYLMLEAAKCECFEVGANSNGVKTFIFADNSTLCFDLSVS